MKYKDRPFYKKKYQFELAEEVTDRSKEAIKKMMIRKAMSLADTIKYYLK
jgi:hypothetical protein